MYRPICRFILFKMLFNNTLRWKPEATTTGSCRWLVSILNPDRRNSTSRVRHWKRMSRSRGLRLTPL
ncbi:hypothetical protein BDY17DRAFT_174944 [Neohortaea acidophila]|uniref:Uncharacterized protein n=1 Tax=Neohortaea acidophila TaxID=245834 RepID=A0A6A6PPF9_9PEZI|nr:uncharacterized protein BDY17DRAFT_174944 [Neohortaea acidophila]KAF2481978.1 hypothetical protein BDY17DRAFT_174944 [Neohortaea acidophila]